LLTLAKLKNQIMLTNNAYIVGQKAEKNVIDALAQLPSPWKIFNTVEWRTLSANGENVGEADVVVFHPEYGLIIFEIKGGAIEITNGQWYYGSGLMMKQSPFSQARRNRYALIEKLKQRIGSAVENLTVTHAAWFPDVIWNMPLPSAEAPSRAFLFDHNSLASPEPLLIKLFNEAKSNPVPWTKNQQQALKELLAIDCGLLVPLVVKLEDTLRDLQEATDQQMGVFRMLRSQSRLLVEGGAGSGKTILACMLAREHALQGKSVLLTCYNKQLALHIAACVADVPNIQVVNFHELAKQIIESAGLVYSVPTDFKEKSLFFKEGVAEQLLNATELSGITFDTIIVDEAADFASTWWVGLEALGSADFSWYCFYDRSQSIFLDESDWQPPFAAKPMLLDINLRNPKAIGEFAASIGSKVEKMEYRVVSDGLPMIEYSDNLATMANQLRELLRTLIRREFVEPERIVVLAPHRYTSDGSNWSAGLNQVDITTEMATPIAGKVRVGTIHGFKGLEADVIILVGIDKKTTENNELLYVGASRARCALHILSLNTVKLPDTN
jgi:hypothetical protein